MDIKQFIRKYINAACVYFTLITFLYMLCMAFINISDDSPAVEASRVLLFFIFSVLWSIADAIRAFKRIPAVLGRVIHFVICIFAFYACFMLPVRMLPSNILSGLVIFTLVYWVILGIKTFFASRLQRNREQAEPYQGQFKKK